MSKTKRCPACQKELPVLAVRCKYCGFKLSNKPVAATARDSFAALADEEAPMVRLSSTPPPPPPARKPSIPPPPPGGGSAKKTMMMGAFTPAPRPVGLGQQAHSQAVSVRTTIPPPTPRRVSSPPPPPTRASVPPPARPSSPPPRPSTPPRPSGPNLSDEALDMGPLDVELEETGSWIPEVGGVADESSILELDTDDSSLMELPDVGASASAGHRADADFYEDEEEPGFFLFRYMFQDEKLDRFDEKGWPGWAVKFLGKLRWIYVAGAAVFLIALTATIVGLAVSGGDEVPDLKAQQQAQADGVKATSPPVDVRGTAAPADKPAPGDQGADAVVPEVGKPAVALPQPGGNCRPLSEYPAFPWKDTVEKISSGTGNSSVCGLFGSGSSAIANQLGDVPKVGPGGYDAVKGGGLLEIFPTGKAVRNGPSMELYFLGDRLYEIRLNYRETEGGDLGAKSLEEAFEGEPEELKDALGRKIVRFTDGDVVVEYVEESWYGRTLKTLVLSSARFREVLAPEIDNYEKAMSAVSAGNGLFGKWKFDDALEKYKEASSVMEGLGLAYVKQALMLTRLEKFEEVGTTARKALDVSAEKSVRAEALGLLAVTALYDNQKDQALARFEEAAAADPANGFFEMSAKELRSGDYGTDRVARTAARMECLKKKSYSSTFRGLLARGNFPDSKTYFDALKKAMADPDFKNLKKDAARGECR